MATLPAMADTSSCSTLQTQGITTLTKTITVTSGSYSFMNLAIYPNKLPALEFSWGPAPYTYSKTYTNPRYSISILNTG
ncbi:MAG: hypothetical protein JW727_00185 [Candidatus Aenigmarchaeota archaeon]|nr:hypothetical protein [Candidatus Aenigmarchaeota archaeon]